MTEYHTLTPAYGRDYISKASAKEGLRSGQDFIIHAPQGTTYCSVRDFRKGDVLHVRIERHRSIASFTLKEDGKI